MATDTALQDRLFGRARTGTVTLRSFDEGVISTLGAVVANDSRGNPGYFLTEVKTGPGGAIACGPPGEPGVPVVFGNPEDVIAAMMYPFILVQRAEIAPAMERWQPGGLQYRAPGTGALPKKTVISQGANISFSGFDRMEELPQAHPFDITYSISVRARYRGGETTGLAPMNQANTIFTYVARLYPAYCKINVVDSIGDLRGYDAFNEGIATADTVGEITEREIGFVITLRVEAELDLRDPTTFQTVNHPLTKNLRQL